MYVGVQYISGKDVECYTALVVTPDAAQHVWRRGFVETGYNVDFTLAGQAAVDEVEAVFGYGGRGDVAAFSLLQDFTVDEWYRQFLYYHFPL